MKISARFHTPILTTVPDQFVFAGCALTFCQLAPIISFFVHRPLGTRAHWARTYEGIDATAVNSVFDFFERGWSVKLAKNSGNLQTNLLSDHWLQTHLLSKFGNLLN